MIILNKEISGSFKLAFFSVRLKGLQALHFTIVMGEIIAKLSTKTSTPNFLPGGIEKKNMQKPSSQWQG